MPSNHFGGLLNDTLSDNQENSFSDILPQQI